MKMSQIGGNMAISNQNYASANVRFFNIVGFGQTTEGMVMNTFMNNIFKGIPMRIIENSRRTFCAVEDAVEMVSEVVQKILTPRGITRNKYSFNIGAPAHIQNELFIKDLAKLIIDTYNTEIVNNKTYENDILDLSNDNTLESILRKLTERQAISKELEERWKSKEHYEEFINIIQNNYIVTPPYNNERLSRQCGMFLLAGCFNFVYTESISESSIEKGYKDLRDEFDRNFFYISGENKKAILEELDTYNINEATLFPELEHQLSYIKNKKNAKIKASSEFIKFDSNDIKTQIIKADIEISDSIIKNESFKSVVIKDLSEKYFFDIQKIWELVEEWVSIIDWNRQESVISRFRVGAQRVLLENGFNKEHAKNESEYISDRIVDIASKLSKRSEK